ncbi:hypothetical protein [Alteraurantiacibacter aquimixticola]|uniref:Uncharacterized protein n=1 Tax=Alteraurantiacibacter aquimixticola TaxID=2489173 RepID=A0A4T3F063_9SPHN|nr:hypothetical protein [Alteraurantiacibacter aquimixticola]TIX50304.1 hypothetical protein E5222_08445 [Alteraurantiacibacter aquimixticola]
MSYDLMVFDADTAPRDREAFMEWYAQQTQWGEGHSYEDASVTTPRLRAWYEAMKAVWFPMNGPDAIFNELPDDSPLWDDDHVTGYTIGRASIYCDFRWSKAEEARSAVVTLAKKHEVGFFDVSEDQGIIAFPGDNFT